MAKRDGISRLTMKAMGIFGGVQAVGVLCSIIRTKLVAIWIGTLGVGLFGLFNNALEMLNIATNLGIRSSSVRDISQATDGNDTKLIGRIITVVRRWSLWLGLAGAILTISLAPVLSTVTFGDEAHIWGFVALSSAVLLMAITNGEYAVFQGLARLKKLAHVTLMGTITGLVVSIPLFYWLREASVLPSIIAYAASIALFATILRNKEYPREKVSVHETFSMGKAFVSLGIFMTIGNFVTILATYLFSAWLNQQAGTSEVGLYQAGYTLINKYTGLILTALGMEYYPRLAKVAESPSRLRIYVSQEINIALLVLAPVITLFVLLRTPVVTILYSSEFNAILPFIAWGMLGTLFRAVSWCMAFVILAKGSGKIYLVTESLSAAVGLALNIVCYSLWGLTGLGWAFIVWYIVYTIIIGVVYFGIYHLRLSGATAMNMLWTLAVSVAVVVAMECGNIALAAIATAIATAAGIHLLVKQWKR